MKKLFLMITMSMMLFTGCISGKLIDQTHIIDAKVENAVTMSQLESLKKDTTRSKDILGKLDNTVDFSAGLINELEISIAYEKQQAFDEGYKAGKKDAIAATDDYVKIDDVVKLLKKQGLYKEEEQQK